MIASDPAAFLARLRDGARQGVLDLVDAERVADALDAYFSRQAPTLDAAFGLVRAPGQRDERTRHTMDERDRLLRAAAERYFPGLSATAQAARLHEALSRFQAASWARDRTLDTCPTRHLGTVREAAWQILRLRDHVLSVEALRRLLVTK